MYIKCFNFWYNVTDIYVKISKSLIDNDADAYFNILGRNKKYLLDSF